MCNELAKMVETFVENKGIRKTFITDKLGVSQSYWKNLIGKKNFNVSDANRILNVIGYEIKVTYDIIALPNDNTGQ